MGDELRGELPALRVLSAPARVVLQCTGYDDPWHRRLDDMRMSVGNGIAVEAFGLRTRRDAR